MQARAGFGTFPQVSEVGGALPPGVYGEAGDPHGPVIELPANERRR